MSEDPEAIRRISRAIRSLEEYVDDVWEGDEGITAIAQSLGIALRDVKAHYFKQAAGGNMNDLERDAIKKQIVDKLPRHTLGLVQTIKYMLRLLTDEQIETLQRAQKNKKNMDWLSDCN